MSASLVVGVLVAVAVATARARPPHPARIGELHRAGSSGSAPHDRAPTPPRGVVPARELALAVVVGCWILHPLLAVVVVGAVTVAPPARARRDQRRRDRDIAAELPDVIDLFRSSVDAGLTVARAIDAVAVRLEGPWRSALVAVQHDVSLGLRRVDALHRLDALGDVARPLTRALIASERDGAPLSIALDVLARDARIERRRRAEEQARRLPVQLLFPLVLCILPAFGLLTVVPLLAGTVPSLTG